MNKEQENSVMYWDKTHNDLQYQRETIKIDDWLEPFLNIINECTSPVLDLGCGGGNDTLYLLNRKKEVIPCDFSLSAMEGMKKNFPEIKDFRCFNMLDGLPFPNQSTQLIIADLCLHYFRKEDTAMLLEEIRRVLTPGGHLIFRVNSVNDVFHGAGEGEEVERHLYRTSDGRLKRFFDEEDVRYFCKDFEIEYLKEEVMTRYKFEKRLYLGCVKKG